MAFFLQVRHRNLATCHRAHHHPLRECHHGSSTPKTETEAMLLRRTLQSLYGVCIFTHSLLRKTCNISVDKLMCKRLCGIKQCLAYPTNSWEASEDDLSILHSEYVLRMRETTMKLPGATRLHIIRCSTCISWTPKMAQRNINRCHKNVTEPRPSAALVRTSTTERNQNKSEGPFIDP